MAEAAIRSVRQAQAEDLACVDVDQLEKVLPQLVRGPGGHLSRPALREQGQAEVQGGLALRRLSALLPTASGLLGASTLAEAPARLTTCVCVLCGLRLQTGKGLPIPRCSSSPETRPGSCRYTVVPHALLMAWTKLPDRSLCGEPGPWRVEAGTSPATDIKAVCNHLTFAAPSEMLP